VAVGAQDIKAIRNETPAMNESAFLMSSSFFYIDSIIWSEKRAVNEKRRSGSIPIYVTDNLGMEERPRRFRYHDSETHLLDG
jgi:hypothetical protein